MTKTGNQNIASACFGLISQLLIVLRACTSTHPRKSHRTVKSSERFANGPTTKTRYLPSLPWDWFWTGRATFCERGVKKNPFIPVALKHQDPLYPFLWAIICRATKKAQNAGTKWGGTVRRIYYFRSNYLIPRQHRRKCHNRELLIPSQPVGDFHRVPIQGRDNIIIRIKKNSSSRNLFLNHNTSAGYKSWVFPTPKRGNANCIS